MILTTTHFLPPRTEEAICYSWQQLIQRIDANGGAYNTNSPLFRMPIYYQSLDDIQPISSSVVIIPCCDSAWKDILEHSPNSLSVLPKTSVVPPDKSLPWDEPTPVLFWGRGHENGEYPFAQYYKDGIVVFYADIISATLFMLSRWEETMISEVDHHGRFVFSESVAYQQGFLNRPIVDEYAHILKLWLQTLFPKWHPQPHPFQIQLSHDIDMVRPFRSRRTAARTLYKDIFELHDFKKALSTALSTLWPMIRIEHSPNFQNIWKLSNISKRHNIDCAFYFMTADYDTFNQNRYKLTSPWAKRMIMKLQELGFEIGFHAGYHTFDNFDLLMIERERLSKALGTEEFGGRQHYLRFQVPLTWQQWEEIGLIYDSTMVYAGYEGFRCGTCHMYRPFDIKQNCELKIWERPLIVMDQTLKQYRKLTPVQGKRQILKLAQKCKQVGGTFTLLWHNTSFCGEWEPWALMYREVVENLADMRLL